MGVGLFLCFACLLVFSRLSFLWEANYPDGSSPITWRSALIGLLLLALGQLLSFRVFRLQKLGQKSL